MEKQNCKINQSKVIVKKIDIYIIKNFLFTFFFLIGIIMSIAIIFDLSEKLDDFLASKPPLSALVLDYYVNFVIHYSNLFSSLLIFISVIFFTSKLAARTEIVAILSSGISFRRLLVPYFVAATILASLSIYFNHYLVPNANKSRLEFEDTFHKNPFSFSVRNIHKQLEPGEIIYLESYNNNKNIGYKFSWEKWDKGVLTFKLMSDFVKWDSINSQWMIERYQLRKFNGFQEDLVIGNKLDTTINFYPSDFERNYTSVEMMTTPKLKKFIEEQKIIGSDEIPFFEIELYQRTSYPFAAYILTLIGVSVASRKTRGGTGLHIAFGLLVCVTYILAMKVTTVYATNAGLDPLIAVWLPNAMFLVLAAFILRKAPK